MKTIFAAAACAALFAAPAFATDHHEEDDAETAAMEKCVADTNALGAENAEEGCTCFVEALPEEELAAYALITDWETEASDAMKEAGAACFPELQ